MHLSFLSGRTSTRPCPKDLFGNLERLCHPPITASAYWRPARPSPTSPGRS
jgi:hypothetical protein